MNQYNILASSSDYGSVSNDPNDPGPKAGKPNPFMRLSSPWMNQRSLGVDINVVYVEAREELKRGVRHPYMIQDFPTMSDQHR